MKQILITGKGSYIGEAVESWLNRYQGYVIDTLDMKNPSWEQSDFSKYDTVFHVAGIAHADVGNVSEEVKKKYYEVNTDLAIRTAQKAKEAGVHQFIFMSSIIIYGESAPLGKTKVIKADTVPEPVNFYGDSKLQADLGIQKLGNGEFKTAILRPPMIYGRGSKGNYPLLSNFAARYSIFPNIVNERSMLYIGNLCEFIRLLIDNGDGGIFFPQNEEYVQTRDMVCKIGRVKGRDIKLVSCFNPILKCFGKTKGKIGMILNKALGGLVYEKGLSTYAGGRYCICNFEESIKETEKNE